MKKHLNISFCTVNSIDWHVSQDAADAFESVMIGTNRKGIRSYTRATYAGSHEAIALTQWGGTPPWRSIAEIPAPGPTDEVMILSEGPLAISDVKYGLANAMNWAFNNRSFAKKFRTEAVGTWQADGISLEFHADQRFRYTGEMRKCPLLGAPSQGSWSFGGNMLFLVDDSRMAGVRIAVQDIANDELRLHGHEGSIHFVMKRVQ